MKHIMVFVLMLLAVPVMNIAHAENVSVAPSYFNQLLDKYEQGTIPHEEEVVGWWAGRCYFFNRQSQPYATLLVGVEYLSHQNPGDHGPIFPPDTSNNLKFLNYYQLDIPANGLDYLSPQQRYNLNMYLSPFFRDLVTEVTDQALQSYMRPNSSTPSNSIVSLRKYQDYFITYSSLIREDIVGGERLEAGSIWQACYYFKKVD